MNIGIYLYDDAEVLDFSGPFEVFSTASRICQGEPPFNVFLISETRGTVSARAGYRVISDFDISSHPALDVLIIAGGMHTHELAKERVIQWISQQSEQVSILASVCTGAFLLAKAIDHSGLTVTTHWEDIDALQALYPALEVITGVRWVDQGKVITSGGISAGIDMSLHLVSRLHSRALAERTARQMEFCWSENLESTEQA